MEVSKIIKKRKTNKNLEKNNYKPITDKREPAKVRKKAPLKWSMIRLLLLCWLLPLIIIAYAIFYVAAEEIHSQTERTIVTSADNAIKICEMRMDAAVEASKNASYLPTIKECYSQYQKDGNILAF